MPCPTVPPIPQEVLMRFRTMRDYDVKMRKFGTNLCSWIPSEFDDTDILTRLTALESLTATHTTQIANLTALVNSLSSASSSSGACTITWETVVTSPYTVTNHNVGLLVDTSLGAMEIRLPDAAGYLGESIYIKDNAGLAGTYNITVLPYGTQTIDDDASLIIDADDTGVELKAASEGWEVT